MRIRNLIIILALGLAIAAIALSCNDTEIYITSQNSSTPVVASCDSTVLKLLVYQDNLLKSDFTTKILNDRICFRVLNTEDIDFSKEVKLRLEVMKENRNPSCRFKRNIIYGTSYIKLRKTNAVLRIFEADIMSFYPVEQN